MANLPHLTLRAAICLAGCMLAVQAQTGTGKSLEMLSRFSDGVEALAARVAPSVVQISVTSFGPREEGEGSRTGVVLGRQQSVGSGVIIDPDGYIVTNAHVVANALRIRVTRTMQSAAASLATASAEKPDETVADTLAQALAVPVDATLVGVFRELDLALIKIPAKNLPALRFADYGKLRQGLVVFAFGSREGLGNSMSMGVVSSVARQPFPDSPFVYIQTDAPINPGDSGGPLVNAEGEIVGLDTFILSQSGGSEGIGFAIPSTLTQLAAGKLRKYGHMHRQLIGVGVQTITPTLASALSLSRESGVLVSDVSPGAPAEGAGVKLNDIVLAINGMPVENVPMFSTAMLSLPGGQKVKLDLLRGGEKLSLSVGAVEESHAADRLADMIDPEKNRIRQLGVVGIAIDKQTESLFPGLRGPYGVIVAALAASSAASLTGLQVGDVIHEVNGAAVALFIERDGKLQYLAFELE
jgi:serine protease Do